MGSNLFTFCANNPGNNTDPDGYWESAIRDETAQLVLVMALGAGMILTDPDIAEETKDILNEAVRELQQLAESFMLAVEHEIARLFAEAHQSISYQYWEAYLINGNVYVGRGLDIVEASARVACGLDIMCANEGAARWLLALNGYWNHTAAEIHGGEGYYFHYHPHRKAKNHIWFYSQGEGNWMKMVIEFDRDADIIEVPEYVVENRDILRSRFWKWISNKSIKHKYWTTFKDSYGREQQALRYRSDAFVEWLNKKILITSEDKAVIVEEHVWDYPKDMPSIFFQGITASVLLMILSFALLIVTS